jgi:Zn-finger nucleic acid-binding protein
VICPICKIDALTVEYKNIELDTCPKCQGVWFDSGELELLLEAAGLGDLEKYLGDIAGAPEVATSEKKRRCPVCRRKMKKYYIEKDAKILVDVCPGGHGIWFDGDEVAQLINTLSAKAPAKSGTQDVLAFIGEMFKYRAQD